MNATSLTEDDIAPGSDCPECDEKIITWFVTRDDKMADYQCAIDASRVEPMGPMSEFSGDTIIVDHRGPSME